MSISARPVLRAIRTVTFTAMAAAGCAIPSGIGVTSFTARKPALGDTASIALSAALDAFVTQRVAADSFSGVVLVARHGLPVYARAVGIANRETGDPMRVDTKLQTASVTKLYTQIAIQQLVQAGKVQLTDTVGRFLPNYPNPVVRRRVTVDQLLRHLSGVGSFFNEKYLANVGTVRTLADYIALFDHDSLLFEPGTSQAYSNGGYVLLGAIVEQASGRGFQEYLRDHVFAPAGMMDTYPFERQVARSNAAVGYTTQPLGGPASGDRRLAGQGPRPGVEGASGAGASRQSGDSSSRPAGQRMLRPGDSPSPGPGRQLMLVGPDGKQLSQAEAQQAVAQMGAPSGVRHANSAIQPGVNSPAGDEYSSVGDFVKLAAALRAHVLLDEAHTAALLGSQYGRGGPFHVAGGGPGVNAEFSLYSNGDVIVVLSNYDPPSATLIATRAAELLEKK